MLDTILLNKNGSYKTIDSNKLKESKLDDIKYVLCDNSTDTRSNTFSFIRAKHLKNNLRCNVTTKLTYVIYFDNENTYFEMESEIITSTLPKKLSICSVVNQSLYLFDMISSDGNMFSGEDTLLTITDNDTGEDWCFNSEEDDLGVAIECIGLYQDVFKLVYTSDIPDCVLALYPNRTWDKSSEEGIITGYLTDSSISPMYVGIPSLSFEFITLLDIEDFILFATTVDNVNVDILVSSASDELYTIVPDVSMLGDDIGSSVSLSYIAVIPQLCRILDMQPRYSFRECIINIDIMDGYYNEWVGETISITLTKEELWNDNVQLLPAVLDAVRLYLYNEGGY